MKRWHLLISLFLCLATQFSQANIHYAPYDEPLANQHASWYDERYKFTVTSGSSIYTGTTSALLKKGEYVVATGLKLAHQQ